MAVTRDIALRQASTCDRPELGHSGPCNGFPAPTCWRHISTCPISRVVLTKIDDEEQGARNIDTPLILRLGGGFETPAGDPIRFVPTHWRETNVPVVLDLRRGDVLVTVDAVLAAAGAEMRNIVGLRGETAGAFLIGLRQRIEEM